MEKNARSKNTNFQDPSERLHPLSQGIAPVIIGIAEKEFEKNREN
jgi:hypothetical protein